MKYKIKERFTNKTRFIANIDCEENAEQSIKKRLAVEYALRNQISLRGVDLSGADFSGLDLDDVDFTGADLSHSDLTNASLRYAIFESACLFPIDFSGADLRGSRFTNTMLFKYPVKIDNIHKVVYQAASKSNSLDMSGRNNSRAGLVVDLAGEGGRALEWAMGTQIAAALIYMASDPDLKKIPDFYSSNREALADMKRLAEK